MSRAEYMRDYRARKKALTWGDVLPDPLALADAYTAELRAEIARLTEEVARLKRELATRPMPIGTPITRLRSTDPSFVRYNPAPKPGKK